MDHLKFRICLHQSLKPFFQFVIMRIDPGTRIRIA